MKYSTEEALRKAVQKECGHPLRDDTWEISADTDFIAIDAGEVWAVKVETVASAGATTGIMVEFVMYIDVE